MVLIIQILKLLPSTYLSYFKILIFAGVIVSFLEIYTVKTLSDFATVISNTFDSDVALSSYDVIFLCAMILVVGINRILIVFGINRFSEYVSHEVLMNIFKNFSKLDYKNFLSEKKSIYSILSSKSEYTGAKIFKPILNFIIYTNIFLILLLSLFLYSNVLLLFIIFIVGTFYALCMFILRRTMTQMGSRINMRSADILELVSESLNGYLEGKINGSKSFVDKRYDHFGVDLRRSLSTNLTFSEAPRYLFEMLGLLGLLGVITFISFTKSEDFAIFVKEIFVFGVVAQRMLPVIQQMYSSYSSLAGSRAHMEELIYLSTILSDLDGIQTDIDVEGLSIKKVIAREMCFSHGSSDLLTEVSFELKRSEIICLVGPSGSGKSTLVNLTLGLFGAKSGQIVAVDDFDRQLDVAKLGLYRSACICPQNPIIFNATLLENVFFDTKPNEELRRKFIELRDQFQLNHLGCNMVINTDNLSGGEKQRIALIRMLLISLNKELLIFDEPTSALDTQIKNSVREAIKIYSKNKITLIISHDEDDRMIADKIIRLGE